MNKKVNVYIDSLLFEYVKIYCKNKDLRLKNEIPKILSLGWELYKKDKNIKI